MNSRLLFRTQIHDKIINMSTAFEQSMPDYMIAEQLDDVMEDSPDLGRTYPNGDDIDIDLGINEDALQDENMIENDPFFNNYDTRTDGDQLDKDDEMADGVELDQFQDHEIQDAPQGEDSIGLHTTSSEVRMEGDQIAQPLDAQAPQDDLIDFGDEDDTHEGGISASHEARELANGQGHVSTTDLLQHDSQDPTNGSRADVTGDESFVQPPKNEEVASPLNSPSFPHMQKLEFAGSAKGDTVVEDSYQLLPHVKPVVTKEESELPYALATESEEVNKVPRPKSPEAESLHPDDSGPKTSSPSVEKPSLASNNVVTGESQDFSATLLEQGNEVTSRQDGEPDGELRHDQEDGYGSRQESSPSEESPDDFHPIIVEFNKQELSLFMPQSDEISDTFLLSDYNLVEHDIRSLLRACRSVLSTDVGVDEELVVAFPTMGLRICESAQEANTTSLAQLRDMYLHFSHNDGAEFPGPLHLKLITQLKVSAQLDRLQSMIERGKGLKDLASEGISFHEDGTEETSNYEANAEGVPQVEQVALYNDGAADLSPSQSTDLGKPENGHPRDRTPIFEDVEERHDDFLDFRSPLRQPKEGSNKVPEARYGLQLEDPTPQVSHEPGVAPEKIPKPQDEYLEDDTGVFEQDDTEFDKLLPPEDATSDSGRPEGAVGSQDGLLSDLLENENPDHAVASTTQVTKAEHPRSSPTLQGDNSYPLTGTVPNRLISPSDTDIAPDSFDLNRKTDSSSSSRVQVEARDEAEFADNDDLGFDFDDYENDPGSLTALETVPEDVTAPKDVLSSHSLAEVSTEPVPITSSTTMSIAEHSTADTVSIFNEDEIDFPPDDEYEQNDKDVKDPLVSEHADSLEEKFESSSKRARPDEDVGASDASPSKYILLYSSWQELTFVQKV